jgi:hypothetical protein
MPDKSYYGRLRALVRSCPFPDLHWPLSILLVGIAPFLAGVQSELIGKFRKLERIFEIFKGQAGNSKSSNQARHCH